MPCGQETQDFFHRLSATGTDNDVRWLFDCQRCRSDQQGASRVEGDAFPFGLGCGVAEAVVAHRTQAAWQDVAQVTLDELAAS